MKKINLRLTLTLSIAIFSMFFGAGNTIYPIALAIETKTQFGWSFLGFCLTAILGPLLGLLAGALSKGNALNFFGLAGKYPGYLLLGASLALLGPFAVLPRCVNVSFAAIQSILPSCSLWVFAFLFCCLAIVCCFKQKMLLPILGYILSPTLIACLLFIIYKGFASSENIAISDWGIGGAFSFGLLTGYETMDLIASIIFSAGIWSMVSEAISSDSKTVLKTTLITGIISCMLLGLIYFGIGHAAALHSQSLTGLPKQELMPRLALLTLGPNLAIVANIAIALACFTTVIGLTMTLSNIISKEIFKGRISYLSIVLGLLLTTLVMSGIGFETISLLIIKVLVILYPLIIALTIANIAFRLVQGSKQFKTWNAGFKKAEDS